MRASVDRPVCPTPSPAVSTAEFSALYERCLTNGLKARFVLSYAAGLQVITVSCSLPTVITTATTIKKRRHRRRRRRCVRAATTAGASTDSPSSTDAAATTAPAIAACAASAGELILTPSLLEANTLPAKRKRKLRNKVELLQELEEEGELLLSPLSCTASPLPFLPSPPSSPGPHASAAASSPLSSPAPPNTCRFRLLLIRLRCPNYRSRPPKWGQCRSNRHRRLLIRHHHLLLSSLRLRFSPPATTSWLHPPSLMHRRCCPFFLHVLSK